MRNENLHAIKKAKVPLIAAHRGTWGGNMIQNTIPAYENALRHGSDIIEIDIIQSTDKEFFTFHSGQEPGVIGTNQSLLKMTSKQILEHTLMNSMQEKGAQKVNRLEDVLEHFKGRCLINIDRSWFFWKDTIEMINRHEMHSQIILKCPPTDQELSILQEHGKEIMYMPIIRNKEQIKLIEKYHVNFAAAEIIFEDEGCELIHPDWIEEMHAKGLLLWVNAITLDDKTKLSAGHDDDTSILKSEEEGWGWLIRKNFDIIQTDWPLLLKNYMSSIYEGGLR